MSWFELNKYNNMHGAKVKIYTYVGRYIDICTYVGRYIDICTYVGR